MVLETVYEQERRLCVLSEGGSLPALHVCSLRLAVMAGAAVDGKAGIFDAREPPRLKLHVLASLDFDLIKAGELIALTALELALTDCYAGKESTRRRKLVAKKAGHSQILPPRSREQLYVGSGQK